MRINWRTESRHVDIETGEVISKKEWSEYKIVNKKKQVYVKEGLIQWTIECKRTEWRQQRLEFGRTSRQRKD